MLAALGLGLIAAGRSDLIQAARQSGVVVVPDQMIHTDIWISHPLVILGVLALLLAIAALVGGIWTLIKEFGLESLRATFPAVDLIVVLATTLLPQLAALPMALFNLNPFDGNPFEKIKDINYLLASGVCFLGVVLPAVIVGLLWNKKLWAIYAGIFFGIYILLFSVCFTNFAGVVMGLVAAVNYWMAQQEVQRGAQPWYYYLLIQIPVYEYLPALLALSAPGVALWLRRKSASSADRIRPAGGGKTRARSGGIVSSQFADGLDVRILVRGGVCGVHRRRREDAVADRSHYTAVHPHRRMGGRPGDGAHGLAGGPGYSALGRIAGCSRDAGRRGDRGAECGWPDRAHFPATPWMRSR